MSRWVEVTRPAWEREMQAGRSAFAAGDFDAAFARFERAHILGQRNTRAHVAAHWWMLRVGRARRDWREIVGQWLRLAAAATMTRIWVPPGNTGGANVPALRPMPVSDELRQWL